MKVISKIPLWMLLCLFALSHTTETIYTSALPSISNYFHISGNLAQFTSSVYFIGFATGILSLGRVSDIFGRRPVVLGGIVVYIISSVAIIFVNSIEMLIVLRFCQAFGASVGSVIGQAMARDSYHGWELSYIYASLSLGIAFLPSLGSTVGGYIVEYSGWRYIFVFLSIVSACFLAIYAKYLPETNPYIGMSGRTRYFTIFKTVIKDKTVLLYAFIIGAFNGMAFGFYIEAPFIFIDTVGMSPSSYGKLAFLLTFASIFGSFISRYLVSKHVDNKKIMIMGLILSAVGCSCLMVAALVLPPHADKYVVIALIFTPMMMHMVGHTFLVPLSLRFALEDYSKVTGTAGSIFGSLYYFLVAFINFTVSKLHSNTITKFALLFFTLSILCSISFYLIQRWHPLKQKYDFD